MNYFQVWHVLISHNNIFTQSDWIFQTHLCILDIQDHDSGKVSTYVSKMCRQTVGHNLFTAEAVNESAFFFASSTTCLFLQDVPDLLTLLKMSYWLDLLTRHVFKNDYEVPASWVQPRCANAHSCLGLTLGRWWNTKVSFNIHCLASLHPIL